MKSNHLSDEKKEALKKMKAKLNPIDLKKELEAKLKTFFDHLKKAKIQENL